MVQSTFTSLILPVYICKTEKGQVLIPCENGGTKAQEVYQLVQCCRESMAKTDIKCRS